jgi:transposase InsO family protein
MRSHDLPSIYLQLGYWRINGGKALLPRRERKIRIRVREILCDVVRLQHGEEGRVVEVGVHANNCRCGVLPLSYPSEPRPPRLQDLPEGAVYGECKGGFIRGHNVILKIIVHIAKY